jgi:hypothetical protein
MTHVRAHEPPGAEYIPIDLSAHCDAGLDALGTTAPPPLGEQLLRGIPFAFARDPARCFVTVGPPGRDRVRIPIESRAERLVFAHRLFDPRPVDGGAADGPLGSVVARYVVRYADGHELEIPIREHFETANIPSLRWKLFVAQADGAVTLDPRHAGAWLGQLARREEVHLPRPQHFYLWHWPEPRGVSIDEVILRGVGRRYLLGALTLGMLDEDPFPRGAPRRRRAA